MGKIHLEVEQGRNLVQKVKRAANELFDSASLVKRKASSLPSYWSGGAAREFSRDVSRVVSQLEDQIDQLEQLGVALNREIDQWVEEDSNNSFGKITPVAPKLIPVFPVNPLPRPILPWLPRVHILPYPYFIDPWFPWGRRRFIPSWYWRFPWFVRPWPWRRWWWPFPIYWPWRPVPPWRWRWWRPIVFHPIVTLPKLPVVSELHVVDF